MFAIKSFVSVSPSLKRLIDASKALPHDEEFFKNITLKLIVAYLSKQNRKCHKGWGLGSQVQAVWFI